MSVTTDTAGNGIPVCNPQAIGIAGGGVHKNAVIGDALRQISRLLAEQGANEYRVDAYEHASKTIDEMQQPVRVVFESHGIDGLVALPTIGVSIAHLIQQFLESGHILMLERLRGDRTAEHLFATIPGVGQKLARRIHKRLQLETLPELYQAARDGQLEQLRGIGRKRIEAIRDCLAIRLRRGSSSQDRRLGERAKNPYVSIAELLDIDNEYRQRVAEGKLAKIAPRRFNPGGVAWLPVLHTHRENRHYTVMYSNSAKAHSIGAVKDWVLIHRDDHQSHGHWTVITSHFGKLKGCRIIPGREDDCLRHYQDVASHALPPDSGSSQPTPG